MDRNSLQERVETMVKGLEGLVKAGLMEDLMVWKRDVETVLDRVDLVCYGEPFIHDLECYIHGGTEDLKVIKDPVVKCTLQAMVCRLSRLLHRKNEKVLREFFMGFDEKKVIRRTSMYLYRGHKCQLTQNGSSKTLHLTVDDNSDDAVEVLEKVKKIILNY